MVLETQNFLFAPQIRQPCFFVLFFVEVTAKRIVLQGARCCGSTALQLSVQGLLCHVLQCLSYSNLPLWTASGLEDRRSRKDKKNMRCHFFFNYVCIMFTYVDTRGKLAVFASMPVFGEKVRLVYHKREHVQIDRIAMMV